MADQFDRGVSPEGRDVSSRVDEARPVPVREDVEVTTPDLEALLRAAALVGLSAATFKALGPEKVARLLHAAGHGVKVGSRGIAALGGVADAIALREASRGAIADRLKPALKGSMFEPELVSELKSFDTKFRGWDLESILRAPAGGEGSVLDVHRNFFRSRYAGVSGSGNLKPVTVGEMLKDTKISSRVSGDSLSVLKRFSKLGLITDEMALSSSSKFGLFRDQTGHLLDTQWASPRKMFQSIYEAGHRFLLPGVGLSPSDLMLGPLYPFVMGPSRHSTIGADMLMPGGLKTGKGLSFSMGDRVFSQIGRFNAFSQVASGVSVLDVSHPGTQFYGRAAASWMGRTADQMDAAIAGKIPGLKVSPLGHFLGRLQQVAGFGPMFQTEEFVGTRVGRALNRYHGGAQWLPNDYVTTEAALKSGGPIKGRLAHIRAQAGLTPGVDPDEYFRIATANPRGDLSTMSKMERFMAYMGDSPYGDFYSTPPQPGVPGTIYGGPRHPRRPMQGFVPVPEGVPPPLGAQGRMARSVPASGVVIPGSGRNVIREITQAGPAPPMIALDFETLGKEAWGKARPYQIGMARLTESFEPSGKALESFIRRSEVETGAKEAQEAFQAIKAVGETRRRLLEQIHSADPEDDVRKRIIAFLDEHVPKGQKAVIVGHNTEFDLPILRQQLGDELFGRYFSGSVVDTMMLSQKWRGSMPAGLSTSARLSSVAADLGLDTGGGLHTALYDALLSAKVANKLHPQFGGALPRAVVRRKVLAKTAEATGGDMLNLFMHHGTERLNTLIGATTGMGFRPTPGKFGWAGNLAKIYGMAGLGYVGLQYGQYADYMAGQAMSVVPGVGDTTPSQYAVMAYQKMQEGRQWLRRITGIQPAAEYMEGLMPGSMSSAASWIGRTVGPLAYGALKGKMGLGLAGTFAFGGAGLEQHPSELAAIYRGDKPVPVRQGRWWSVGLTPWEGGKISHYRPHWSARYLSNWQYTDSLYGSGREYFSYGTSVPTPHNMFGLLPMMRPDYFSEKHYWNRPYPYSETGQPMHQGESVPPLPSKQSANMMALGLTPQPGTYQEGLDPTSIGSRLRHATNYVTELGGLYKWFAEQVPGYQSLFGGAPSNDVYSATASTITSGSRRFYDESVGGLVGMTELLRRFLDVDKGKQGINLIPNQMPSWLPGYRAENPRDKYYFNDFQTGDPYAKVPGGEYRLPGKGYESMRPLHSHIPGVYDAVDRYMILADVAPWSESFKQYRAIVESWANSGALDVSWKKKFEQTEEQVETVILPQFQPRIFSGVRSGTLEELARVNKYSMPERILGGAWERFTHDAVPAFGRIVPVIGTYVDRKLLGQRSAYEAYLEQYVYGTDFQDWTQPYESFLKPRVTNLVASSPPVATLGGAALGMFFGATPAGMLAGAVGAAALGTASTVRTFGTGQLRGGWVPSAEKEAGQEEQYFDALSYMRFRRMQSYASGQGNALLARQYGFAASRTGVGMDYSMKSKQYMEAIRYRVGSSVKDYMWQFSQAPYESRPTIMKMLPPMSQPLMSSMWARQGDKRYKMAPDYNPDVMARKIVGSRGTPPGDWPGWQVDVPMDTIKVRTLDSVHNHAFDMHRHNLWEADRRYADRAFPSLTAAY